MKKIYFLSLQALFLLVGINMVHAQYGNGVLIANEGNFGSYNATVSYIDSETLQITNGIYNMVNNADIGDVLQNIGVHGDNAYLVVNNSNKVIVVDRESFQEITTVTENIAQPRYIAFANDKYYVTNSSEQNVTVYDVETNNYITQIEIGYTVEEIVAVGNHVFVQNGWFGSGNSISVIDATTDQLDQTIEIEEGINGLESDGAHVYAISSGADFTHVYKIDGTSLDIVSDARTTAVTGGKKLTYSEDMIFFGGNGTEIYAYSTDALVDEPVYVFSVTDNSWSTLYGFGVVNGYGFSGDANGFTAPSIIDVYHVASGNHAGSYEAGIGANGFYANFADLATSDVSVQTLEVDLYPNPVVDFVQIKGVDRATVQVYNVSGKLVKTFQYNGAQINVSDLNSGLYFFTIANDEVQITKKVLVK